MQDQTTFRIDFDELKDTLDRQIEGAQLLVYVKHKMPDYQTDRDAIVDYVKSVYGPLVAADSLAWQNFFGRHPGLEVVWKMEYPMSFEDSEMYEAEDWTTMREHLVRHGKWFEVYIRSVIETLMGAERFGIAGSEFVWNEFAMGILKYKIPKM